VGSVFFCERGLKMSTNRNFPAYGGVFGQRHVAGGYVAAKVGSGAPIGAVAPQIWAQNVSVSTKM